MADTYNNILFENDDIVVELQDVKDIEDLGIVSDIDVYDIEVENCHNFFANDILVHNSLYVEGYRLTSQLGISEDDAAKFLVQLWEEGLQPYLNDCFDKYAKYWNCDKNLEVLELEKIARSTILLAKKHYAMEASWIEPGIFLNPLEDVIYKGLEIIQGSTPKYAKQCQDDFYRTILEHYIYHTDKPDYAMLIEKLRGYKEKFKLQNPEDICKGAGVGDYEKFIVEDFDRVVVGLHCPIHVKGSGIANYLLNKNPKYKAKYEFIKTGDKVKFYYSTSKDYPCFAFLPNKMPVEYAPPIDYDTMFEKSILEPCNRVLTALGFNPVNMNMCWAEALW